ncbi:AraC family transcriptional regulator [Trinickia sp. YCB016]
MRQPASRADYSARLQRVLDYIYDHLDDELDLNRLADIACLSPYHWHRVYQAMYGETIAATVRRLRLHRAAGYLAKGSMPIDKIAQSAGYGSLQAFTRTFSAVFGMPPAQYRKNGTHRRFQPQESGGDPMVMREVEIREVPAMQAVTVDHTGSYMQIGKAFDTLFGWLASNNLLGSIQHAVGIFYDDPSAVAEAALRSKAGAVLAAPSEIAAPLSLTAIPGGQYAVLRHQGPYADMAAAYQWLYGEWLPQSGREAADAPAFEEYLNNPRNTPPAELLTDICLPLK